MKATFPFLLLGLLMAVACRKDRMEERILIVADHRVNCTGSGPQQCYLVKEKASGPWQFFYEAIGGFDHEAGFEYVLEVRVYEVPHPPADDGDLRYVLKRIISKR